MGKRQSYAYRQDGGGNDERHDLDPSDWYIVKDGKMYKTSVYPNQEREAIARGYSRTRDEAKAKADQQGVAEGSNDNSPVSSAITRRILMQRADLLSKYGPVKVMSAIEEVADFVGDVDEIGSSDVSGWIKHVEQILGNMTESNPQSHQAQTTLKHLKKASYGDRADAANIKPGIKGVSDRLAFLQRAKDEGNLKEEAAGVGVVKDGNDPRYVMATTGDQNDVDGNTLKNMMKAYHLFKKK
jgi:hypothetical protein